MQVGCRCHRRYGILRITYTAVIFCRNNYDIETFKRLLRGEFEFSIHLLMYEMHQPTKLFMSDLHFLLLVASREDVRVAWTDSRISVWNEEYGPLLLNYRLVTFSLQTEDGFIFSYRHGVDSLGHNQVVCGWGLCWWHCDIPLKHLVFLELLYSAAC